MLSSRPHGMIGSPVRPHKVRKKVRYAAVVFYFYAVCLQNVSVTPSGESPATLTKTTTSFTITASMSSTDTVSMRPSVAAIYTTELVIVNRNVVVCTLFLLLNVSRILYVLLCYYSV